MIELLLARCQAILEGQLVLLGFGDTGLDVEQVPFQRGLLLDVLRGEPLDFLIELQCLPQASQQGLGLLQVVIEAFDVANDLMALGAGLLAGDLGAGFQGFDVAADADEAGERLRHAAENESCGS